MPEISDQEYKTFVEYQTLGSPAEIRRKRQSLEADNKQQRDELRELKDSLPAQGAILLSAEDGAVFEQYRQLGTPTEIQTRVEEGQTAVQELRVRNNRDSVTTFAKAAGLADAAVDTLLAIPDLRDAKFEVRKVKQTNDDGAEVDVEVPYVTMSGGKAMRFSDAQDQLPAIRGLQKAQVVEAKPAGTQFVKQGPQGGDKPEDMYTRIRREEEAKKEARKSAAGRADSVRERFGHTTA